MPRWMWAVEGVVLAMMAGAAIAQGARQYTDADYRHAESMMDYNVKPLVDHEVDKPTWMADGRFVFRDRDASGTTWTVVDPARGTKAAAFDQGKLAHGLEVLLPPGTALDAKHLPVTAVTLRDGDRTVEVTAHGRRMRCDLSGAGTCAAMASTAGDGNLPGVVSPDGRSSAFIRDWNLWVRDLATGRETALTKDGVKDFGYATDNAGWKHTNKAILLWSPDSKKIATFQQDQRRDGEMYLVPVTNRHPVLQAWKYPLVGDKDVTTIERVILDVHARKVVRLKMPPDQHRSTICDDVSCSGGWEDVQWSENGKHLAFASSSRDHREVWLRVADATTEDVRDVLHETAPKFFESGNGRVNWRYLPRSNEVLWFSERSNWGEMYLYDLATGALKNAITTGEGNVTEVLYVDEQARRIYFLAVGREAGWDPYYQGFYSVGFDGQGLKLLTPEKATHVVTVSRDGKYFVDAYSTPTEPQTAVVRDSSGRTVMEVAKEDISRLLATGWKPLTPFTVKARDGQTDLYGFLFRPTAAIAGQKYPLVDYVYPGPQVGSCGSRAFSPAHGDLQSLAELGFVAVCLDGMGTPLRSKAFHEAYYGNLGDNTIPDQMTGIQQLAARFPDIDVSRVGLFGHSGGGNATAAAMFRYPDFFKVGIAESGNHDQRDYEDDWAEKWAGLEVVKPDGTSNYDSQANQSIAKNLKGHLLLAHGTMDDNVPMNNTLLVVDALIKANKDFDLLIIPNVAHGYGADTPYMTRRRWDYFVRYLRGDVPPHEYLMKPWEEEQEARQGYR